MTPPKLIWVGVLPPHQGGAAVSGFQLLVGLARAGHTIRSLAPITPETVAVGSRFAAEHPQLRVTRFEVPYFETNPVTPAPEAYREVEQGKIEDALSALIERDRPDVVLLGRETFAWRAPAVARRYGIPCILRIAGGFLAGLVSDQYPSSLVSRWVEQARMASAIVAQTTSVEANLTALGLSGITLVPNAVDLRLFAPQPMDARLRRELRIADDHVVVMHLSNLKPLKRGMEVIESAALALRQNPKLVYVIVGDGRERSAMEASCQRLGIADDVRFAGWVPYERVPAYLNLADVVVMASDHEAQARIYLETQACGRTLVTSDIPAARHVVDEGVTGLLFRKGDVADLTAVTLRAAADAALRAGIGAKARERAMAHSLDHIAARYSEVIDDVVERARGAGRRAAPDA
jgi:L-malate glycosyltransferase